MRFLLVSIGSVAYGALEGPDCKRAVRKDVWDNDIIVFECTKSGYNLFVESPSLRIESADSQYSISVELGEVTTYLLEGMTDATKVGEAIERVWGSMKTFNLHGERKGDVQRISCINLDGPSRYDEVSRFQAHSSMFTGIRPMLQEEKEIDEKQRSQLNDLCATAEEFKRQIVPLPGLYYMHPDFLCLLVFPTDGGPPLKGTKFPFNLSAVFHGGALPKIQDNSIASPTITKVNGFVTVACKSGHRYIYKLFSEEVTVVDQSGGKKICKWIQNQNVNTEGSVPIQAGIPKDRLAYSVDFQASATETASISSRVAEVRTQVVDAANGLKSVKTESAKSHSGEEAIPGYTISAVDGGIQFVSDKTDVSPTFTLKLSPLFISMTGKLDLKAIARDFSAPFQATNWESYERVGLLSGDIAVSNTDSEIFCKDFATIHRAVPNVRFSTLITNKVCFAALLLMKKIVPPAIYNFSKDGNCLFKYPATDESSSRKKYTYRSAVCLSNKNQPASTLTKQKLKNYCKGKSARACKLKTYSKKAGSFLNKAIHSRGPNVQEIQIYNGLVTVSCDNGRYQYIAKEDSGADPFVFAKPLVRNKRFAMQDKNGSNKFVKSNSIKAICASMRRLVIQEGALEDLIKVEKK